jgi:hypothetical protein
MKAIVTLLGLSVVAQAGPIYGALHSGNQPAANAEVRITCPGNHVYPVRTGPDGSYRLRVNETGRCGFDVSFAGKSGHADIFSYNDPVKYDFDLITAGPGYALKPR